MSKDVCICSLLEKVGEKADGKHDHVVENGWRASDWDIQIKSNLFAINSVHNITIHEFVLRLAGQTGDNFALMSGHDN